MDTVFRSKLDLWLVALLVGVPILVLKFFSRRLELNQHFISLSSRSPFRPQQLRPVTSGGSTAVSGCCGKGIIDLLVIYPPGGLKSARQALDRIGFQRQGGAAPFPESRPMRVGSFAHFGRSHRIHAHVLESGSAAAQDLIRFRDLLRQDIDLRRAYEAEKRAILARGITQGNEYSQAKGDFIRRALRNRPERL